MILLGVGAEMLARLLSGERGDGPGPDTAWLLSGPTELAVEPPAPAEDWPLAAE